MPTPNKNANNRVMVLTVLLVGVMMVAFGLGVPAGEYGCGGFDDMDPSLGTAEQAVEPGYPIDGYPMDCTNPPTEQDCLDEVINLCRNLGEESGQEMGGGWFGEPIICTGTGTLIRETFEPCKGFNGVPGERAIASCTVKVTGGEYCLNTEGESQPIYLMDSDSPCGKYQLCSCPGPPLESCSEKAPEKCLAALKKDCTEWGSYFEQPGYCESVTSKLKVKKGFDFCEKAAKRNAGVICEVTEPNCFPVEGEPEGFKHEIELKLSNVCEGLPCQCTEEQENTPIGGTGGGVDQADCNGKCFPYCRMSMRDQSLKPGPCKTSGWNSIAEEEYCAEKYCQPEDEEMEALWESWKFPGCASVWPQCS